MDKILELYIAVIVTMKNTKYLNRYLNPHLIGVFAIFMFFLLISTSAFADTSLVSKDMFAPIEKDVSLNVLSQLFGDLIAKAHGGENPYVNNGLWLGYGLDPFQFVLKFFNMICLSVGGALAAYSIGTGIVNTAHEGVFFGKNLSHPHFWVRTGVMGALIMPVWSGYCVLQVVVMWFVIGSVGIADTTWKAWFGYNEKSILDGAGWGRNSTATNGSVKDLYSLKMPSPQSAEVIYKAFEGYTCLYGLASEKLDEQVSVYQSNKNVENAKQYELGKDIQASQKIGEGETIGVIPNNLNGGVNTGNVQAFTVGSNKTQETVVNESQQHQIVEGQKQLEETKQTRNAAIDSVIGSGGAKLDSVAQRMFGDGMTYNGQGAFIFGVGNNKVANNSVNVGNAENNSIKTSACGSIDFTTASGSRAQQRLYDVAYRAELGSPQINGGKMADGAKETWQKMVQSKNSIYGDRHTRQERDIVLGVYQKLFQEFQGKIRNIALTYVSEINEKARFRKFDNDSIDPDSNLNFSANEEVKAQALIKANQALADVYTEFEQKLIIEIHNAFVEEEEKYETAMNSNGRLKHASISDLKGRDRLDSGNFVSFISQARRNAETDGWFTAGMWFMSITNSVNKLHELTTIRPELNWAELNDTKFQNMLGSMQVSNVGLHPASTINSYYGFFEKHAEFSPLRSIGIKATAPMDTSNSIAALATGMDLNDMFDTGRHPMIVMTEAGHNLIATAQQYMTYSSYWQTKTRPQITNEKGQMVPDPNNPASQAHVMVTYLLGAIMVMGFMMAYYLPMLPFLIWLGAGLGWLIAVIEAIFLAPLWGAMHLHPEGSKYVGKGNAGYGLLASLVFRPTLMILGLIASIVVIQVYGMFVNYVYSIGMKLSLNNTEASANVTVSKMMYVLAVYFTYLIFNMALMQKMVNIITIIPDNAMKWIGNAQGNLSEYGALAGSETQGKLNALAGSGGNAYANALKEKGEMAGRSDAALTNAALAQSGVNDPSKVAQAQANSTGKGFESLKIDEGANIVGTSTSQFADARKPYQHITTANTSIPSTPIQRQQYEQTYDNSLKMSNDAGIVGDRGHEVAQRFASMGYSDAGFRATTQNWADRGVMGRNPEASSQAIIEASEAPNSSEANQILVKHVQTVSNSKTSIQDYYNAAETKVKPMN